MFAEDPNSTSRPFMMPAIVGLDPAIESRLHRAEIRAAQPSPHHTAAPKSTPRWRARFEGILARKRTALLPADHELFTGLERKELAQAEKFFDVVDVPSGRSLGAQGGTVSEFVAILEGRVGVTIDGVPHAVLDDGSQFGGLSLIDDERPTHRASFDVMAPSRIAVVTAERFPDLLRRVPTVAERIHTIARVRRAYLAGLAAAPVGESIAAATSTTGPHYPVHLRDTDELLPRREIMQVRARTSR